MYKKPPEIQYNTIQGIQLPHLKNLILREYMFLLGGNIMPGTEKL